MKHGRGKSDRPIVPEKPSNKPRDASRGAEEVEERGLAKGNPIEQTRSRTRSRNDDLQKALERIRQVAIGDRKRQFTSLWHHVYKPENLRETFHQLRKDGAPGVDGLTWKTYARTLPARLEDLSSRLARGAYRAKPVRRVYIPKSSGGKRPLGIPGLEDKLVQSQTSKVLSAIYEEDFLGFSYGFRPGRSTHNALDALHVGISSKKVNWVLDADIRGFFDAIDHGWMMKFLEHRIRDQRVLRHVKKWLNAGVLEQGRKHRNEKGTPQGGSISPLLANIYLHYALDLWVQKWRRDARGDVIIVRYADDFVVGFQHEDEARRFWEELKERLLRFSLELHPEKTRLIRFGRFARQKGEKRGQGKPETFDFLGFTHICSKTRNGKFVIRRLTMVKRMRRKLSELKAELRRRMPWSIRDQGIWLAQVLRGHYEYYAVPLNYPRLEAMWNGVKVLWCRTLRRRSQRSKMTWKRFLRFADRWLPRPRILLPYPNQRLCVITRGRSPVR